jgi:uncharacterized membrane protein YuzA (DUF378 family)
MRKLDVAGLVLAAIGAINWGLVSIAEFDLVATVFGLEFGEANAATRTVYGLVGVAGIYVLGRIASLVSSRDRVGLVA